MLSRQQRKNLVQLLKCPSNVFPVRALRSLLFASSNQRNDLFAEIKQNGIFKTKYSSQLYGKNFSQLGSLTLSYNSRMSCEDSIQYAYFLVGLYSSQLNAYISLREQYEQLYLLKNYTCARKILDRIDRELCISLWSCGQRLLLSELEFGLEANKEELSKLNEFVPKNYATLAILHHYSCLAESNLSYDNYQLEITKFLKPLENTDLGNYLTQKLSLNTCPSEQDISIVLQIDSQFSIIDLFNDLESIIPLYFQECISSGEFILPSSLNSIKAPIIHNLSLLDVHSEATSSKYAASSSEKMLYQIIESYTIGDYAKTLELSQKYLDIKPFAFQVAVIFCKTLLHLNSTFPSDFNIGYVKNIYSIYKMDSNYRDAVLALEKELKQNHGSVLCTKIQSFLSRKHLLNTGRDYSFTSSLLDESLHPNFIRYLSPNKISLLKDTLYPYCPVATSLACALKSGFIDPIIASQVEEIRLTVYNAETCCNNGDSSQAMSYLTHLMLNCDPDNLYLQERIQRLQLKVYAYNSDYYSAIQLLVNAYLRNEFLFERLLSGNYIQIPNRLRQNDIESDLLYVIYVFLLNRSDYSRQIRAYSNYLELNNHPTIFDALENIKDDSDILRVFFFSSVCTLNLLKRDVSLCELGITPEAARLRILSRLNEIKPQKQYVTEINSISTFEVMRDNMNSINKSRINVDVDKIIQQHQEQWEETYQKYLRLSKASQKFISIDFNEHDLSVRLNRLTENLNVQIKNSPQINQETMVLRSILEQILEECLFSTQYGLETYLSSRIRHGFCRGQLTSFLSELHLISLRDRNDNNYFVNTFWDTEFKGTQTVRAQVKNALSIFTAQIEDKIDEICREWLRIKYKDYSVGMFDYSTLVDLYLVNYQGQYVVDFHIFYSRVISLFWLKTNVILKDIRTRITGELQKFYIDAIETLETNLKTIPLDSQTKNTMKALLSQCTVAKSKVVIAMEQFKDVFYANNAHYNNFTMQDLASSCKKVIGRLYTDSETATWNIDADNSLLFDGKYFVSFVDILCILLNNALSHSGFTETNKLKIDLTITNATEEEKLELANAIPEIHRLKEQNIFKLQVRNNLSSTLDDDQLQDRLTNIFLEIKKEKLDRTLVQGEGGSGLHKLCKTIDYNIEAPYYISYDVSNHSISISYVFAADQLLHREE